MKKLIRVQAATLDENIIAVSKDGSFELIELSGLGMQMTPWKGLTVVRKGLGLKHVVDIHLNSNSPNFNGEPVRYKYYDCYISHGNRMQVDSDDEVRELISVLEEALEFEEEIRPIIKAF